MPRKKNTTALVPVRSGRKIVSLPIARGGAPVVIDAAWHVPAVHPTTPGPWAREPDKIAWTDERTGYACIIRRSPKGGHLGGFVAVPPEHPLYGYHEDVLTGLGLVVHGGVSYSEPCDEDEPEETSICHVSTTGDWAEVSRSGTNADEDDAWWFGFACDGPADVVPDAPRHARIDRDIEGVNDPVYRAVPFVYRETVQLAAQLRAIEDGVDPAPFVDSEGRQGFDRDTARPRFQW